MYCSNCGTPNSKEANWCISCGQKLNKPENNLVNPNNYNNEVNNQNMYNNPQQPSNIKLNDYNAPISPINYGIAPTKGGIRKQLKEEAKNSPKSSIIGYMFSILGIALGIGIVVLILTAISALTKLTILSLSISILYIVIIFFTSITMAYGLTGASIETLRYRNYPFRNIINKVKSEFKNICAYSVIFIFYYLIILALDALIKVTGEILLVPIILTLAKIIGLIYITPALSVILHLYADSNYQKEGITKTIKDAFTLIKGHRIEYYGLQLSFIGWYLLMPLTLGILSIWLIPYIKLATANFYRRIKGEIEVRTNKTGISNGGIIILVTILYALILLIVVLIPILANYLNKARQEYRVNYKPEISKIEKFKINTSNQIKTKIKNYTITSKI